jgi:hypothetical protein
MNAVLLIGKGGQFEPQGVDLLGELFDDDLKPISFLGVEFEPELELLIVLSLMILGGDLTGSGVLGLLNLVPESSFGFDEPLYLGLEVLVVVVALVLELLDEILEFLCFFLEEGDLLVLGVELGLGELCTLTEDVVLRGVLGDLEL